MMNWQQIEDQWGQLTTQASAKWLKLTDEDLAHIAGKQERLISKLQERYGVLKDDAEKQVHQWFTKLYLAQDKARSALARAMPVPPTKTTAIASTPSVEKAGT
jgi:uncharacterized protein YjbJ (UPF0337 family)